MKVRSQVVTSDGFDKNVAEKMPRIRKLELEEPLPSDHDLQVELPPLEEDHHEIIQEVKSSEKEAEKEVIFQPPKRRAEAEQTLNVLNLIGDLHHQLLAWGRVKRALEMDLASSQKTIHQLARDNQELRSELEEMNKELQKLKGIQTESVYLKEENLDALERIQEFQQELRDLRETLARTTKEKDEALSRIQNLESQIEQNDLLRIQGKLKEREASHFMEENRELQSRLEEAMNQNIELERKYEALRKSFNEIRESLTFLRDSCKTNYYNLSENPE